VKPLAGKVAIVTGASKGMGRHFLTMLVNAGAKVAALARPSEALAALRAESGDDVLALECDISDSVQVNEAVAKCVAQFGRLDLLVNNAAIFHPFLLEKASDEDITRHVDINILGTVWMTRAAIPHLRQTRGQIVSISSESVRNPFPMLAIYAATKAAVEAFSAGIRDELRSEGIRVTVLRSGSVAGGTGGAGWSEATSQAFYKKILATGHAHISGEPASPESMAQALLATVSLPADVCADLIEVRSSRDGVPDGTKALRD
jgi:NADP-dependent 3-hydroxy acid dehydrogenase YdfG